MHDSGGSNLVEDRTDRMKKIVVAVFAVAIFACYFFMYEDTGIDYWDTYIAVPATFLTGKPAVIVNDQGEPAYDQTLQHRLPHDLYGKGTYGIVSRDQRIGAGVTFAPAYLVFGELGFRYLFAIFGLLGYLLAYQLGLRLSMSEPLALALGLLISVNPFMLSMNRLNANSISVPILTGLAVLLMADRPRWFAAGLVYGALGGIRNEAIMLVPALCVLMLWRDRQRWGMILFGIGAAITISPYLYWNKFAFGKALIHSSQFSDFGGHRPSFLHSFFGYKFEFNGLFNWPLHDHLVRTPHYPFPTYFTLPLVLILCFGTLFIAFAALGLFAQWKRNRPRALFWFLWIFFILALFLPQENWEEPKTTFGALIIPALAVLITRGIQWVGDRPFSPRRIGALAASLLVVELFVLFARGVHVPVDERWYERFPKAKPESSRTGCLSDLQRREWMFFHTDECESELRVQRAKLTRGNLLPALYYPLEFGPAPVWTEWGHYEPEIFDIWEKIYGY